MSAPTTAMTVAKWFAAWAETDEEAELSNLKLQKLLYYAQGFHLALHDRPLFPDEIQAWAHGPVVPSVYRKFKKYGAGDVHLDEQDNFHWGVLDEDTTQFLIRVWNTHGDKAAWKLRNMTHAEPPWRDTYRDDQDHIVISQSLIKDYFKSRVKTA